LISIRLQGYYRSLLPDILNCQAASLKSLSLHDQEVSRKDCQRIPLSLEELEEIGTKSPGLEMLALDVNISEEHTWPKNILDALASPKFSSLKKLTVFSLIGIAGEMVQQPEGELGFTIATAEEDIKNLCSSLSTTPLEEIEVHIGEKRTVRGKPMSWVLWEMSKRKVLTMRKEGDGRVFFSSRLRTPTTLLSSLSSKMSPARPPVLKLRRPFTFLPQINEKGLNAPSLMLRADL